MNKLFLAISLCLQFISFGQVSNVKLPLPKIETKNIESTLFQNGQSLNIIKQSSRDFEFQWANNIDKPSVLITQSNEYLYNYSAIKDTRNICPESYRIISEDDLAFIISRAYPFGNYFQQNLSDELLLYSNSIIQPKENSCTKGEEISYEVLESPDCNIALVDNDCRACYIISKGETRFQIPTIYYYPYTISKINRRFVPDYSGVPVRCIEDLNYPELFKNNIFKYQELRQQNYLDMAQSLKFSLQNQPKVKETIKISVSIRYNSQGILGTTILSGSYPKGFTPLKTILSEKLERPFYENINIQTCDTLQISISPNLNSTFPGKLDLNKISPQFDVYSKSKTIMNYLDKCRKFDANAIYKSSNNLVSLSVPGLSKSDYPSILKVKNPGPINSLFAVIPGLGVYQFKKALDYKRPYRILFSSSISLFGLAVISKSLSLFYYSNYRSNIDAPNAQKNYQIANYSQKAFVVSSALYASLALVDFTWTFSLGVKSKHYQHQANKELRLMQKQNLWL